MYGKLIMNDIRKSKLVSITTAAFIVASAALTSAAAMLGMNLSGAVDHLMEEAKAVHFLQMHSGDIDVRQLQDFADTQGNVEAYQLLRSHSMTPSSCSSFMICLEREDWEI